MLSSAQINLDLFFNEVFPEPNNNIKHNQAHIIQQDEIELFKQELREIIYINGTLPYFRGGERERREI